MTKAMRYQRTDRAVTEVRVEDAHLHLGMVHKLAHRMKLESDDFDELVQIGTLALMRAVHGYRPEFGCAFSTYAYTAIERSIIHHHRYRIAQRRDHRQTVAMTDEVGIWIGACDRPGRMETEDARRDTADRLAAMLAVLDDRDAEVLLRRAEGLSFDAIAGMMGLSRERVRQLERDALRSVRLASGLPDTGKSLADVEFQAKSASRRRGWSKKRESRAEWAKRKECAA